MWYNTLLSWLLRSPFHGFLSGSMMLISFRGRKSGKAYSTPVNYFRAPGEQGEYLVTFSKPERVWWRNLRDGAQVTLHLQGKTVRGQATASQEVDLAKKFLNFYLTRNPKVARYFDVQMTPENLPEEASLTQAAEKLVVVLTRVME